MPYLQNIMFSDGNEKYVLDSHYVVNNTTTDFCILYTCKNVNSDEIIEFTVYPKYESLEQRIVEEGYTLINKK